MSDLLRFRLALQHVPAELRDDWLRVGMALHHESGGSQEGFDLWSEWSQKSAKYDPARQRSTWLSFKGDGITGASIFDLAMQHGWRPADDRAAGSSRAPKASSSGSSGAPASPSPWLNVERRLLSEGFAVAATYPYWGDDGKLVAENVRFEHPKRSKTFAWRRQIDGKWFAGSGRAPLPPFGLPRVLEHADEIVFVVEGEKDASRLNNLGMVAVSIVQGHERVAAKYLVGRTIFVIPDQDPHGDRRASAVLKTLASLPSPTAARRLVLPGLPEKGDVSDWLDAGHTSEDLVRLTEEAVQEEANQRLANVTWSDDVVLRPAARELIKHVLPATGIGFLYGPSYSGKTFAAHDIAMSVARGVPLAGQFQVVPGVAVFIALEAEGGVHDRHIAYRREHRVNGARFAFLSFALELAVPESVNNLIDLLQQISAQAKAQIDLLVIDTLAKSMPGMDENSSKDMSLAVKHLEIIQKAVGGCVMAVHHTGKDAKAGMRGSSAAFAAADFVLRVDGTDQGGIRELHVEKLKNGLPRLVGAYRFVPVVIGKDQDGEDIEAAIIKWCDGVRARSVVALTAAQRALMNHLVQLLLDGPHTTSMGQSGFPPVGTKIVRVSDLVERCLKGGDVSDATERHAARTAISRMIKVLQSKSALHQFDGMVWKLKEN